jgi:hypothetical protein
MKSSVTRPTPTPSSTGSCTTPTASTSQAKACVENSPTKLDTTCERNDNNHASRAPAPGSEIISESGGGIISEQRGGFVGIGIGPPRTTFGRGRLN